jgi:hypothetical protein
MQTTIYESDVVKAIVRTFSATAQSTIAHIQKDMQVLVNDKSIDSNARIELIIELRKLQEIIEKQAGKLAFQLRD